MKQVKKQDITTNNKNNDRNVFETFLNGLFVLAGIMLIFFLCEKALEVCISQCNGSNCRYATECVKTIAGYCCAVLGIFVYCNCRNINFVDKALKRTTNTVIQTIKKIKNKEEL